ncbi:12146_t:CDS:2, partial [Racocetra fulgida]
MDNNIVPNNEDNTGESNSSDINVNIDIGGSNRRITEESNINEPLETSTPQNTTEQASETPLSNIINATASRMTSGIFPITSTSDTDIHEYQESISRSQLSSSELFMNLEDVVTTRPKEYSDPIKPRPNSQILLPTSMQHYDPFAMPSSDQEFRMLARILNWPAQPGQNPVTQISGQVGSSSIKDNMVDGGEIIFDTSIDQEGDIQQSKGQHPYKKQSTFYVPHSFSVADAMRQMTKPLQMPEVPPLISTNYGKEIFDQIKSDDDPRLIVWSKSRAQEIKHDSTFSISTTTSKRWSFHETLRTQRRGSKNDNSIVSSSSAGKKLTEPQKDLDVDKIMVDSGGGSGVGTSLIEESANIAVSYDSSNYYTVTQKQSNILRHQSSSSSLDSTITPGTTDSESEAIEYYTPNISGVSRKETHRNIIYSSSSNSHTSDEDLSSKATHDQIDELYGQKWSKNLPTSSSELGDDIYTDNNVYEYEDDGAG